MERPIRFPYSDKVEGAVPQGAVWVNLMVWMEPIDRVVGSVIMAKL